MSYLGSHPINIDPSRYKWSESTKDESSVWSRPLLSNECVWQARPKRDRDMFIYIYLNLARPVSVSSFIPAAKHAWKLLFNAVPELSAYTTETEEGVFFNYRNPLPKEVEDAVVHNTNLMDPTIYRRPPQPRKTKFDFVKQELLAVKATRFLVPGNAFLLFQGLERSDKTMGCVSFMLNIDHLLADGIGARIIAGKYLQFFASSLLDPLNEEPNWHESHRNLSRPWICVTSISQSFGGLELERMEKENTTMLCSTMKNNPGISMKPPTKTHRSLVQKTHFITLLESQTTALLAAIRRWPLPNANITHLAHASMVLAMLRRKRPRFAKPTLHSPIWVNGRRYLHPDCRGLAQVCICFFPVKFEYLPSFFVPREAPSQDVRKALMKAVEVARNEHEKLEMRSVLTSCVNMFEEMGKDMRMTRSLPQQVERTKMEENPILLSDGYFENHIAHTYPLESLSPSFRVDNIKFAASAEDQVVVRISSWQGQITIQGEWRKGDYEEGVVMNFLEDMVKIMNSIIP